MHCMSSSLCGLASKRVGKEEEIGWILKGIGKVGFNQDEIQLIGHKRLQTCISIDVSTEGTLRAWY